MDEEKRIRQLEQKIKKEYLRAYKEIMEDYKKFTKQSEARIKKMQAKVDAGEITQKKFKEWKQREIAQDKRYQQMIEHMADVLTNASKISTKMIRGEALNLFVDSCNYEQYVLCKKLDAMLDFTIYNVESIERIMIEDPDILPPPQPETKIPKEKRWNMNHLKSEVIQGIIQGKSIQEMAKRFMSVTNMDTKAAVRNARTAMSGAVNAGHLQAYKNAQDLGIKLQKQWMAILDQRTRHTHRIADMETADLDKPFSNGLMFPGDTNAKKPEEVYNCRCRMVSVLEGYKYQDVRDYSKLGGMTYEEWKHQLENKQGKRRKKAQTSDKESIADDKTPKEKIDELREKYKKPTASFEEKREYVMQAGSVLREEVEKNYLKDLVEKTKKVEDKLHSTAYGTEKYWIAAKEYRDAMNEYSNHKKAEMFKSVLSQMRPVGIPDSVDINKHLCNSKSKVKKYVVSAFDCYPSDWVKKSADYNSIHLKKVSRGFYLHDDYDYDEGSLIAISARTDDGALSTAIHELGHRFENTVDEILSQEKSFYERRTKNEPLTWLGTGYSKKEKSRKDDFIHPYMGKDYGGDAYELVSMGFQYAYTDPQKLAGDKDMQEWIYGLLCLL